MTDAVTATSSSATNIAAGQANLSTSYSTFLTLLTTQLKNQDPTSPLDPNQFTQQLVQMTGVQQQLLTNQLLQQISGQSASGGFAQAVGLIGKTATASTANAALSGGQANWSYSLPAAAASGSVTIADSTGKAVWSGDLPDLSAGAHGFAWNGRDLSGTQLPDGGTYTLSVAAKDASGGALTADLSIQGAVSSVQQSGGATIVKLGATSVPLSSITGVGP